MTHTDLWDPLPTSSFKHWSQRQKKKKPIEPTGSQPTRKNEPLWCVMLMLGEGWCLDLKRGESKWEKENRTEKMRKRREKFQGKRIIFFFFLQNCYSAILSLELHCSSITNLFAIGYIVFQMWKVFKEKMLNEAYMWHLQYQVQMLLRTYIKLSIFKNILRRIVKTVKKS